MLGAFFGSRSFLIGYPSKGMLCDIHLFVALSASIPVTVLVIGVFVASFVYMKRLIDNAKVYNIITFDIFIAVGVVMISAVYLTGYGFGKTKAFICLEENFGRIVIAELEFFAL